MILVRIADDRKKSGRAGNAGLGEIAIELVNTTNGPKKSIILVTV